MMKYTLILIVLLFCSNGFAKEKYSIVAVGKAGVAIDQIYLSYKAKKVAGTDQSSLREIKNIIESDFGYYADKYLIASNLNNKVRFNIELSFNQKVNKTYSVSLSIRDLKKAKAVIASSELDINLAQIRTAAHQIADQIYRRIAGKESIFNSKIIFVSDRGSTKKRPIKELYQMDYDGKNKKQLTRHRGTVISPALSSDGSLALYSLIKERVKKRNVNLYLYNFKTKRSELISSRKGINSGAVFMPGGKEILLTLSHSGNAEIYILNLKTKALRPVTKHYSPDVDPSINISGTKMAFLSARSGKPMIYLADPRGVEKAVKRVSFVGKFNATPRFSPDGMEIAFSSWLDTRFDIFRIDHDGGNLVRLTKDFGSNEDPSYSNDGQFIAFSSQRVLSKRKAVQKIYIMTREGEIRGSITDGYGNCITPRWSK